MSVNYRTFVVANPHAAAGAVKEEWTLIERLLRTKIPEFDHAFTEGPGHATLLAREALRAGWEMVVAIGGDGTLNEVVNGFFEKPDPRLCYTLDEEGWLQRRENALQPVSEDAVLGLVPFGTGGDFRRSVGFMGGMAETIDHLEGREVRPVDVGQIGYLDPKGALGTRYFINIASAGLSGLVDSYANGSWKGLGGKASFGVATVRAFATYKNLEMEIRFDETAEIREKVMNIVVANGAYFGGGMWIAPGAELDDGQFQVVIMGDLSRIESVGVMRDIYKGTHLAHRKIHRRRARQISARLIDTSREGLIDLDGETPGKLPAIWNVHPSAIRFKT
ncbi:MAG: diacylglycerol/lipid kinase family protein [Bradymonadaceae bacterium]